MANDSTIFPFQMSDMHVFWPTNDVYGCSPNTLTQLQEKVLRSLSRRQEEDNLQVVPEHNDAVFEGDYLSFSQTAREDSRQCPKMPFNRHENRLNVNFPRSPRLCKSPRLNACNSLEPLCTPTFPFSPILKSPGLFSAPASPLAMMVLSPFGRKPSEDLSMYLPENFTPAATLERLERSISTTVFEFPSIAKDQNDYKEMKMKAKTFEKEIADEMEIDDVDSNVCGGEKNGFFLNAPEIFLDFDEKSCFEGTETLAEDFEKQSNLKQIKGGRKRGRQKKTANEGDCALGVGFRNGLERKRRSEMNSKYDKLRKCIPELENREKASKILVLKTAVQYMQELQRQDELLSKQKDMEKLRNEELLKKLVKINS